MTAIAARRRLPSRAALKHSAILGLLAGLLCAAFVDPAAAQTVGGGGSLETFLQNIVNIITGRVGQLIAVLAIALVGIGWALGAVSPRTFLGTVAGIAILFSAGWIVGQITGVGT